MLSGEPSLPGAIGRKAGLHFSGSSYGRSGLDVNLNVIFLFSYLNEIMNVFRNDLIHKNLDITIVMLNAV